MVRITSIEENKKNKDRVSIYVEGEFLLACDKSIVYKKQLRKDMEVSTETLLELAKEDDRIKAKDTALRQLERGYKTEHEVRQKLTLKEYSEETIEETLKFLRDYDLVDDRRYATLFVTERIRKNGVYKIKNDLLAKGIDKEIIQEALDRLEGNDAELDSCMEAGKKKLAILKNRETDPYKLKNKLYTYLAGRGYSRDTIMSVLSRLLSGDDD